MIIGVDFVLLVAWCLKEQGYEDISYGNDFLFLFV
jgi:hypothetical protein